MKIGVYSVLDRKAGAYGALLFFANDGIAGRTMREVMGQANDMSRYPEDFDMYHVGWFDNETGILAPADVRLAHRFSDFVEV
nr:MAG: nonstructural protein [Microvirus sp.]